MSDIEKIKPGYFGKLPNFPDFMKFNAAGDELLTFDKWIQEGILNSKLKFKNEWEVIYKNSPSYNFLFNNQETKNHLAGSLFPSKDKTNRYYPFLTMLKINKSHITDEKMFFAPIFLKSLSEKILMIYNFALKCISAEELNNLVANLEWNLDDYNICTHEYEEYLNNTKLQDFWERILDKTDGDQKFTIINNLFLFSSYQNTGNQNLNSTISFALKFPLSIENIYFDAAFWINLFFNIIFQNCKELKDSLIPKITALFWPHPNPENFNSLFIIFGRLSPEIFLELISSDYKSSNSIDVKNSHDSEMLNHLPADFKILIENKYLSLYDFLHSI